MDPCARWSIPSGSQPLVLVPIGADGRTIAFSHSLPPPKSFFPSNHRASKTHSKQQTMTRPSKRLLSLGRMAARAAQQQGQHPQPHQRAPALAAAASAAANAANASGSAGAAVGWSSSASASASSPASVAATAAANRPYAAQAQAVEVQQQHRTATLTIPEVRADLFGAVSPVDPAADAAAQLGAAAQPFENADGRRHEDGRYAAFSEQIASFIPKERVFTDPVRTFAYGTDASFYRLNPRMVVKVHSEAEVRKMLPIAKRLGVPVTFRAAGTSLSGQAITDSVLIKLSHTGRNFRNYEIHVSDWLID